MSTKKTTKRTATARRAGKSDSTQAGEFVREEIEEIRAKKHGARSTKQAIAIGLSNARRAGVKLPAPRKGTVSEETRKKAKQDSEKGRKPAAKPSRRRSIATTKALKKEGHAAASTAALRRQSKAAAARRTPAQRSAAARKAARTRAARKS